MILTVNRFFKINQTLYQIFQLKAAECQSFLPFSLNDVHLCEVFLQVEYYWEMLSIAYFFCSTFFDNKFISLFLSLLNVALNVGVDTNLLSHSPRYLEEAEQLLVWC